MSNQLSIVLNSNKYLLGKGSYHNGRLALLLLDGLGNLESTVSVNLPGEIVADDEVIIKNWSENVEIAPLVLATGIFEDTGRRIPTGFVEAEVWKVKDPLLFQQLPELS
ncbi:MAG: hypothetical protein C0402_05250 [Thermodesulfovibrio sp.]|nr:hypothetical protein [Thermodesulfovibrio sp.]